MMSVMGAKRAALIGRVLRIVLAVGLGLLILLYLIQTTLVFRPDIDRDNDLTPAAAGLHFVPLKIATPDGETLVGWFVPGSQPSRALVIFFHGNAGAIGHRVDSVRMLNDLGLAVLIVGYRGYGRSSGRPSETGTYTDAEAIWRYATERLGYTPGQIVLFGESLGGAVASWLATRQRPAALVLASTFTSIPDLGADLYPFLPVRLLANIRYDSLTRMSRIDCPVLVIHSPDDDVVPVEHGRRLFAAARPPKQYLEIAGGHNVGFVFGRREWVDSLNRFLQQAMEVPSLRAIPRGDSANPASAAADESP